MNAKENYYFGILERNVGFKKGDKITLEYFKKIVQSEKLFLVSNIEFNPNNIYQADSVFLIKENERYKVLTTGERASGITFEFEDLGCALNYMLSYLRFKKKLNDNELEHSEKSFRR